MGLYYCKYYYNYVMLFICFKRKKEKETMKRNKHIEISKFNTVSKYSAYFCFEFLYVLFEYPYAWMIYARKVGIECTKVKF